MPSLLNHGGFISFLQLPLLTCRTHGWISSLALISLTASLLSWKIICSYCSYISILILFEIRVTASILYLLLPLFCIWVFTLCQFTLNLYSTWLCYMLDCHYHTCHSSIQLWLSRTCRLANSSLSCSLYACVPENMVTCVALLLYTCCHSCVYLHTCPWLFAAICSQLLTYSYVYGPLLPVAFHLIHIDIYTMRICYPDSHVS